MGSKVSWDICTTSGARNTDLHLNFFWVIKTLLVSTLDLTNILLLSFEVGLPYIPAPAPDLAWLPQTRGQNFRFFFCFENGLKDIVKSDFWNFL